MEQNWVLGFYFDKERKNLVVIEKQSPEWQKDFWNGIGGKIESNETEGHAMFREFYEETGVKVHDWTHFATIIGNNYQVFCFVSFGEIEKCKTQTNERMGFLEWEKWLLQPKSFKVIPNLKWLIPLSLDNNVKFPVIINDISEPEDHIK